MLNKALTDYYRCPDDFAGFTLAGDLSAEPGYFRFGQDTLCYGRCTAGNGTRLVADSTYDALEHITINASVPCLPFDPMQVVDNLRCERYSVRTNGPWKTFTGWKAIRKAYYFARPLMPVKVRRHFQKFDLKDWDEIPFPAWPVDHTVDQILEKLLKLALRAQGVSRIPFIWFWPEGYSSCATMTHDVEQSEGLEFCQQLMDIDDAAGIKAAFQIVPEQRYTVSPNVLQTFRDRGFEVNVQDLNHDGHLYQDREEFLRRAEKINRYLLKFGSSGFRAGSMYRNPDWYDAFDFSFDMSIPNVAHLEPQRGGCCTVMPYFIGKVLELPLTTTQDYSLFHILDDYSISLWKRQIELIMEKHGLVSFIIHPDYVIEERAGNTYQALLDYLCKLRSEGKIWIALPGEVDRWWRARSQMKLVERGGKWAIEGAGKERARIAYAVLEGDDVLYSFSENTAFLPAV
ncbi:MAG: polysaccharide deacetylase family protein [Terriglobia bacterium]